MCFIKKIIDRIKLKKSIKAFLNNKPDKSLPIEDQKWNKLWNLWCEAEKDNTANDNYIYTLMTYSSEINNGGHQQFFFNTENTNGDFEKINSNLKKALTPVLFDNYIKAYNLYKSLNLKAECIEDYVDIEMEEHFDEFDKCFYANEKDINKAIQDYANTIEL